MKAEIISVGTELLLGEILNTDARYLALALSELGIDTYYQSVVGDNKQRLTEVLENAMRRSEVIITSGGLGPTQDDITKEVISECVHRELEQDDESLERMREYLNEKGVPFDESNIKQALLPKGAKILPNDCGTAPGCIIEENRKIIVMLPGPPVELEYMFEHYVKPYFIKKSNSIFYSENLKIFGMSEARVSHLLDKFINEYENPTVAPYAQMPGVRLRLTAKCNTTEEGKAMLLPIKKEIKSILGEVIYSDKGETLPQVVINQLAEKKMTISAAESCTGGLFAKMITDVSGSSAVLCESYVTYANEAKEKILGVSRKTLIEHGAVSPETAEEMALGLYRVSGSDVCVCFTGIAGPGGGTKEKPVGLVYVGLNFCGKCEVYRFNMAGDRDRVRTNVCMEVFDTIRKKLNNKAV